MKVRIKGKTYDSAWFTCLRITECEVIKLKYIDGYDNEDIVRKLSITRECVRQRIRNAIDRLEYNYGGVEEDIEIDFNTSKPQLLKYKLSEDYKLISYFCPRCDAKLFTCENGKENILPRYDACPYCRQPIRYFE